MEFAFDLRLFVPVPEVVVGQVLQRDKGRGGVGAGGGHDDLVAPAHSQNRHLVDALAVGRSVALEHANIGLIAPGRHHEAGRRAGVQPQAIAHEQCYAFGWAAGRLRHCRGQRQFRLATQLLSLHAQRVLGFGQHLGHRRADHRLDGGGHRALDQRRPAQEHMRALFIGQKIEGRFGAQQGAAQVHEDHDAVVAIDGVDGLHDLHRVRADGVFRIVDSPGNGQRHAPLGHLLGQFPNPFGQLGAMRDDD